MITVIGIGTQKGELTQIAAQLLAKHKCVYLRTKMSAAGKAVVKEYPHAVPLDDVYDSTQNFDEWVHTVCDTLIKADKDHDGAVYATDGDGCDAVAAELNKRTQVQMVYGVAPHSSQPIADSKIKLTATDAVQKRPYLDTTLPLHVTEIDDGYLAGDLKLWLMEHYGDEQEITLHIHGKTATVPLCDLDRQKGYGYDCELFIAAQEGFTKQRYTFGDLLRVMARLTAADGCPWDKAQTHESIRTNMIEEAYEAVDAIDAGDLDAMTEEFGDVLLQAIFHCNMAERTGEFSTADVLTGLCRKLVGRHTHIFGENKAQNADEALGFWEAAKSEEKSYVSTADKINRLPEGFPSLLAAQKVYKKLKKAGIDAPLDKSDMAANDEDGYARLLFLLCARAANDDVDLEVALHKFVATLKREYTQAEKDNTTADFLQKLCK